MMIDEKTYDVHILASRRHGTLYIGVTNSIVRRIPEHRDGKAGSFTKEHGVTRLVHFEVFESVTAAIQREKSLKKWPRIWKINPIERENQDWIDLYPVIAGVDGPTFNKLDGAYGSPAQGRG
jgi:putative endonuclease